MKRCALLATLVVASCSLADPGVTTLRFTPSAPTKAAIGSYFTKLNLMLFNEDGVRVFDKVQTQTVSDSNFGSFEFSLQEGKYTVVAVGHSSAISATIKSPEAVQFTASNGEKLTDTFCYCGDIDVGEKGQTHSLVMNRVAAMFRLWLTDTAPSTVAKMKFDYTGGSANFNPSTSQGITKSTQSETRAFNPNGIYEVYTFPYLSTSGTLKMTVTALSADGTTIRQREFTNVPVAINTITTYTGPFFQDGDGEITQSSFGFTVNGDWASEQTTPFN